MPTTRAFAPFIIFLACFLGPGIYYAILGSPQPFAQVPPTVAIIPALFVAIVSGRGPFEERLTTFLTGMADQTVLLMVLIFLLAGAFSALMQQLGATEAMVTFGLWLFPPSYILPGLFLTAALIGFMMGTSMGTIATVCPIALSIADTLGGNAALYAGTVISGAMFGDNLSTISDTTIAAVTTQGANIQEKMRLNARVALPAMLLTLGWLYNLYTPSAPSGAETVPSLYITLPYIAVLAAALMGIPIIMILAFGSTLAALFIIIHQGGSDLSLIPQAVARGFGDMYDLVVLCLLITGITGHLKSMGGHTALNKAIESLTCFGSRSSLVGEFIIAAFVSLCDIFTANNTIAILLSSDTALFIRQRFTITAGRAAYLLDTFSCVWQGILPYSAQILLAANLANISPLEIMTQVHYCFCLGIAAIVEMLILRRK